MRYQMSFSALLAFLGAFSAHSAGLEWKFLSHTRNILSIKHEGNDLWMGTGGGLVRMNRSTGRLAEADPGPVETEMNQSRIVRIGAAIKRIEADGAGGHWVLAAGGIWKVEGTTWTSAGKSATSLVKAFDGTVIACGRDSLLVYRNGSWGGMPLGVDIGYGKVSTSHLAVSTSGRVWAYTHWTDYDSEAGSILFEYDFIADKIVRSFGGPGAVFGAAWKHMPYLTSMAFDSAGTLWGGGSGLYRMADTGMVKMHSNRISDTLTLQADRSGGLWAAGQGVAYHISGPTGITEHPVGEMGFGPSARIQALSMDAEGVLWVGTHLGLASLTGQTWKTWPTSPLPLPSNSITALATGPDGAMWIGSDSGLVRYRDSAWMVPRPAAPDPGMPKVTALSVHANGAVWGIAGDKGVFRFLPDGDGPAGEWEWFSDFSAGFSTIQDIAFGQLEGSREIVWAIGNSGLRCIRKKDVFYAFPNRIREIPIGPKSLAVDSTGRVWLGTPQYLMSFDGTDWREELNTGLMDLVFDKAGRLWGQGDSAFHWMEAGVWRKHPFQRGDSYGMNTVNALVQGPGDAIIFQHQLCFMSCGSFLNSTPRTQIGLLSPKTVRILEAWSPRAMPSAIAYDNRGQLWLGTGYGLAISSQMEALSIGKRDAKRPGGGHRAARLIPPDEWVAGGRRGEDSFDMRGRLGKAGSGLRAEIPAAPAP